MPIINWRVRLLNQAFWLAFIPAVLLLAQTVLAAFGITYDFGEIGNRLIDIVKAVFALLAILGIVTDPTTSGVSDSLRALSYEKPYED